MFILPPTVLTNQPTMEVKMPFIAMTSAALHQAERLRHHRGSSKKSRR